MGVCHYSQGYILSSDNTTYIGKKLLSISLMILFLLTVKCSNNNGGYLHDSQDNSFTIYYNNTEGFFQCVCDVGYTDN